MRQNDILIDKEFLLSNFSDISPYYIETLGRYIHNFLMNVPVPIIVSKLNTKSEFTFSIGNNSINIAISEDYAYHDYVTLIRHWATKFYVQFTVILEEDQKLSEQEIMEEINELQKNNKLVDVNELLVKTVKVERTISGIIEKVIFKKDEFVLNFNEYKEIRIAGSRNNILNVKTFMKNIRNIEEDSKKYQYLLANSTLVKKLDNLNMYVIDINYTGLKLVNFFKINYIDLKDYILEKESEFVYTWRNFRIHFENQSLKDDCLEIYKELSS